MEPVRPVLANLLHSAAEHRQPLSRGAGALGAGHSQPVDQHRGILLYAVVRANGELLVLHTERVPVEGGAMLLNGRIESTGGKTLSSFRLCYAMDADLPLPLRLEFRPRPFLRLTFERTVGA